MSMNHTETLNVRVPEDMHRAVLMVAAATDTGASQVVRAALYDYFERTPLAALFDLDEAYLTDPPDEEDAALDG